MPVSSVDPSRILGCIGDPGKGPTVIVVAGLHGNERAGVEAARRVLAGLEPLRSAICGRVVCLAGNLQALRETRRFLHKDLNRQWTPGKVAALRSMRPAEHGAVEDREQLELLETIEGLLGDAAGTVYFVDLHTSSAAGAPFVTIGDTLRNREFALNIPLPIILGLEEQVDGSLLEFLNNYGFITLGVEAGQHDAPASIDHHEAVVWLALVAAKLLRAQDVPRHDALQAHLATVGRGVAHVVEVRHRHAIEPADQFRMVPGFSNFQRVHEGQLIARDRHGDVCAPEDGMLLLPLYQGQGDDGFFMARPVRFAWLRLSSVLRRLRVAGLIRLLPGVRRNPDRADELIVDTRVARYYPLEIFHLFGFRKIRREGRELIVSRRAHDLTTPRQIKLA